VRRWWEVPFQALRCGECGRVGYVEYVDGYWLCRYCRRTLEEDGWVELKDGTILKRGKT
jgi:ribosomal protein L37AE/L43A